MHRTAFVLVLAALLASCSTTRPYNAYTLPNGTRVGQSKQIVFLRPYDAQQGSAVAMDHAHITKPDSLHVKRRVRAFGSAYITTVTGHD